MTATIRSANGRAATVIRVCSAWRPPAISIATAISAIALPQASLRASDGSPADSLDMDPSTSTAESAEVTKKITRSTMVRPDSSADIGSESYMRKSTVS